MDRRRFLLTSLGAVLVAPVGVQAKEADKVARVAFIATTSPLSELTGPEPAVAVVRGLLGGLQDLGWYEGKNFILERRTAAGQLERFGEIIRELVNLKCDVIITAGNAMAREAQRVTASVPIVMHSIGNPVGLGLVSSFARPGGNITGITDVDPDFEGKRLAILKEALPKSRRVAVIEAKAAWDSEWGHAQRAAAAKLGVTLLHAETTPTDLSHAFATIRRERPDAAFVGPGSPVYANRHAIIDFAARNRLPLMGQERTFTEAGAFISYGSNRIENGRSVARYVDRILRGAKPGDLPIEQSSKFELVINLKTAKALGLTIPQSLLLRADHVIE